MFPDRLDNASVLFYTAKGQYGKMYYTNGDVASEYSYLAICKYENCDGYYLFKCNQDYEVEADSLWDSIDECMRIAQTGCEYKTIEWIKREFDWN